MEVGRCREHEVLYSSSASIMLRPNPNPNPNSNPDPNQVLEQRFHHVEKARDATQP